MSPAQVFLKVTDIGPSAMTQVFLLVEENSVRKLTSICVTASAVSVMIA